MSNNSTFKPLSTIWWLTLIQAFLMILLGSAFVIHPNESLFTLIQFLAFYWVFSGMISIIQVITGSFSGSKVWGVLSGIISIFAGSYMVAHPLFATGFTSIFWMYFIGVSSLMYGITQLINGISMLSDTKGGFAWGSIVLGIFNTIFGILLLMYPMIFAISYIWVIGLFLIIGGIAMIFTAFKIKSLASDSDK